MKLCTQINFHDLITDRAHSRIIFLFAALLALAYSLITVFTITPQVDISLD